MIGLQLALLFFLFRQGGSQEPEPVFRPVGHAVEMGYCYGEDYIVVYRVAQEGDQLLGNSSAESPTVMLPLQFQRRISISRNHRLLGLQIRNLTQRDSGTYRRECWVNQTLVKHDTQQLTVCNSELESQEIQVNPEDGGAEVTCNSSAAGQEGVSVVWYRDIFPTYTITHLLDSRHSLEPVDGILEVKDKGATLVLDKSMLSNNQHFYCLIYKDTECLSFQDLYIPESLESRDIFASEGDKVVLFCQADGNNQYWETPMGKVENTEGRAQHVFITNGEESQQYSLVITAALAEHFGDYSCVSSMSEVQYSLVSCPRKGRLEEYAFEKETVVLNCDIGQVDSYMVQWYRRQATGQHELISDSGEDSVPIPEDLRGRVHLEEDSVLSIKVKRADEGLYWCVVIKGVTFLEIGDDEYIEEYEDEEDAEDAEGVSIHSDWEDKCLFKQEFYVSVRPEDMRHGDTPGVPPNSGNNQRSIPPPPTESGQERTRAAVRLTMVALIGIFVL